MLLCYFNCRIDFHLMMMVIELKSQPLNNVVYLTEKIFPHRNALVFGKVDVIITTCALKRKKIMSSCPNESWKLSHEIEKGKCFITAFHGQSTNQVQFL